MANLAVTSATASVNRALLTEAFSVNVTVKNTTNSTKSAYLIFTIDGSSATAIRSDFSIGAKKTIIVTATFDGSTHPSDWATAMQSRRVTNLYVAASDNGTTTSDAYMVDSFEFLDAYYAPKIEKFIVERTADEADTVKATIKLSHASGLTSTQISRLSCTLSDWDGVEYRTLTLNRTMAELFTGVTDDTTVITDTFVTGRDHTLTLVFGDTAEAAQQIDTVDHAFANLHLSGASTGGACFGGFCKATEGNPMLESYYPIYAYSPIYAQAGIAGQYSTTEGVPIGTWTDGKTIYRKVVQFYSIANGSKNDVEIGEPDIAEIIRVYGVAANNSGYRWVMPHYDSNSVYSITMEVYGIGSTPMVRILPGGSRGVTSAWVAVEYTLTT